MAVMKFPASWNALHHFPQAEWGNWVSLSAGSGNGLKKYEPFLGVVISLSNTTAHHVGDRSENVCDH
jgi:hypothetical protein